MLILIWCLLSWFPNIRWYEPPFSWLDKVVRPMVAPFQKLIPPISNIDLSPMVAMLVIQAAGNLIINLIR